MRSYHTLIGNSEGESIADIGGADGDLAFFLESLGYQVDFVDHAPTNANGLRGVRTLRKALNSAITINDVDLDSQFALPHDHYRLVIFLRHPLSFEKSFLRPRTSCPCVAILPAEHQGGAVRLITNMT